MRIHHLNGISMRPPGRASVDGATVGVPAGTLAGSSESNS
jgi:hypothetical protein